MRRNRAAFFSLKNRLFIALLLVTLGLGAGVTFYIMQDTAAEEAAEPVVEARVEHAAREERSEPLHTPRTTANDKAIDIRSTSYQRVHSLMMLSVDAVTRKRNGHQVVMTLLNVSSVEITAVDLRLWSESYEAETRILKIPPGYGKRIILTYRNTTVLKMVNAQWYVRLSDIAISPRKLIR